MRISRSTVALLVAVAPAPAAAQALQAWPTIYVAAPLGGGVFASGELIGRDARSDERPSQLEARAELGYTLTRRLVAWAGYVHVATYRPGSVAGIENQAVEQLDWTVVDLPRLRVGARTRLEQRWLRGDDATAWRVREQLRVALALGGGRAPQAIVWAEPFVALNRTAQVRQTFDQLRLFAGIGLPLTRRLTLETGYLRQQIRQGQAVDNNVVPIVLSMRF